MNKEILLSLAFTLFAATTAVKAQTDNVIDDVISVIGEDMILKSDLEKQYITAAAANEDLPEGTRCQLLDELILNKVLKAHAVLDSLVLGPDEIEYQLDERMRILASQVNSDAELEAYYGKTINQIKAAFRPLIIDKLLAEKKREEVVSNVRVTPAEVKRFFYRVPDNQLPFYNAEVEMGQIVMYPEPSEKERISKREFLESLKDRIETGENFIDLAKEYSEDPGSKENGGDLGYFRKGQMVEQFEDVAFKLVPGEISRIVESKFGFHLIQLIDRQQDAINARHILIKPEPDDVQMDKVKDGIWNVYDKIEADSLIFEYAVAQYSEDETSRDVGGLMFNPKTGTTYFEIEDLLDYDPTLYYAIDELGTGDISKPHEFEDRFGRKGYRIIYVQKQRDPHKMNLEDDFEVIKERALEFKKTETLYQWLDDATRDIFIAIDPEYRACPNTPLWLRPRDVS